LVFELINNDVRIKGASRLCGVLGGL
jgi:hypothetical protein